MRVERTDNHCPFPDSCLKTVTGVGRYLFIYRQVSATDLGIEIAKSSRRPPGGGSERVMDTPDLIAGQGAPSVVLEERRRD